MQVRLLSGAFIIMSKKNKKKKDVKVELTDEEVAKNIAELDKII